MKKHQVTCNVPGSAEYVIAHAQFQAKRGKNPSVSFGSIRNPRLALRSAIDYLDPRLPSWANESDSEARFNRDCHPERQPDEVWVTNADDDYDFGDGSSWEHVGWKTKRRGEVAYDINGVPLGDRWHGSFPVFAKQSEIAQEDKEILQRMLPRP